LFDHAAWNRDSVLYEELIERVRAVEKGDERWADFLRQATADLQKMKAGKERSTNGAWPAPALPAIRDPTRPIRRQPRHSTSSGSCRSRTRIRQGSPC
jgi:hypothetical protein